MQGLSKQMKSNAFMNIQLSELLRRMGQNHTYDPQFMLMFLLMIQLKRTWCQKIRLTNERCYCVGCQLCFKYSNIMDKDKEFITRIKSVFNSKQLNEAVFKANKHLFTLDEIIENHEQYIGLITKFMLKVYTAKRQTWLQNKKTNCFIAYFYIGMKLQAFQSQKQKIVQFLEENNRIRQTEEDITNMERFKNLVQRLESDVAKSIKK